MPKFLISIVGPTAIGKTKLSLDVAEHFGTEIISADSRQFFKEIPIGTAAPEPQDLKKIKHHFIHNKSIKETYNVGLFETEALNVLDTLLKTHNAVVMVGGSGLYVDAVCQGLDQFPTISPEIRIQLNKDLETNGLQDLQLELKRVDPKSYETIAIENPHRVIRALEIHRGTGTPYSSFLGQGLAKREFEVISIGLKADRSLIYERINQRVDLMIKNGLIDEVKSVKRNRKLNALNTVGYKELFSYLDGSYDLETAVSEIKKNTRRFAKRQITWFRKNTSTVWFDYNTPSKTIIKSIEIRLQNTN
jgi:tRNA dimethylallyltransferase